MHATGTLIKRKKEVSSHNLFRPEKGGKCSRSNRRAEGMKNYAFLLLEKGKKVIGLLPLENQRDPEGGKKRSLPQPRGKRKPNS